MRLNTQFPAAIEATHRATPQVAARKLYDAWHSRYEVDVEADSPLHRMVKANISEKDLASKNVLEIGCGRGGFSCWLARQPHTPSRIFATDFSSIAVEKGERAAHALNLTGIEWRVGDIHAIGHPDESFDTVVSCETMERVQHPRQALAELARVLKPGGRLFLTTPNYFGIMGLYRLYLRVRRRTFAEEGQPIKHFLPPPRTRRWVTFPGRPMLLMPFLEQWAALRYWFGSHSLIVAEKTVRQP
jgi:2-polyprenyl-3-methyl-5-hydroxy-6-metoxy-1,4-benzoquinol methylase